MGRGFCVAHAQNINTHANFGLFTPNAGSLNFFYDTMYRQHPTRHPVPDNDGSIATRSELNEYNKTDGALICRDHFASNFSILFKFKAEDLYRFTVVNMTNKEGGVVFSLAIDMVANVVTVKFDNCSIISLALPVGINRLQSETWHRISVAIDQSFIALYVDCSRVYTYPIQSGCTVICDETVEISVLESYSEV